MPWVDWKLRMRSLVRRRRVEADLRDELEFHLNMEARKRHSAGESLSAARRGAAVAFGGEERVLEECRQARGTAWLDDFGRDLQYSLRRLRRTPGFTLLALATLTLGIGANTALFTLVNAVLLQRLPVPHPEQLVMLGDPSFTGMLQGTEDHTVTALTYAQYQHLRNETHVFAGLLAVEANEPTLGVRWSQSDTSIVGIKLVSANYFSVLGMSPARGRFFATDDAGPDAAPEAVMSYGYWQAHFGGDPGVVGRTLRLRSGAYTVIGVAPRGFTGTTVGQVPGLYFPIALQTRLLPGRDMLHDPPGIRRVEWLQAIGRLRPGVSLAQAAADCNVVFARSIQAQAALAPAGPVRTQLLSQRVGVSAAASGASAVRAQFAQPLWILFTLVGIVLLVVVVNLGGMLLAQASGREREFALRLALGARRGRLVRQLLTESLLLAAAGACAGWWLAQWGERLLVNMVVASGADMALALTADPRVLAFTAGLAVLAGVAFGMAPAWRLSRTRLGVQAALRPRGGAVRGIVVAQVALSIVLVVGAALFIRSLSQLRRVNLGYDPANLMTLNVNAVAAGATGAQAVQLYGRIAASLARLPGVRGATFSENGLFWGNDNGDPIGPEGYTGPESAAANFDKVAPGYFATLGIPVLLGREFTPEDTGSGVKPVVVDAALVRHYFAHVNPIGKHMQVKFSDGPMDGVIVGVVAVSRQQSLRDNPNDPRFYLDVYNGRTLTDLRDVNLEMRTDSPNALTTTAVKAAISQAIGAGAQVNTLQPVESLIESSLAPDLLLVRLTAFFGLLALVLAAMGIYAMLSYAVARRRAEIGIRMALGADAGQVRRLVLGEAAALVAAGVGLGAVASLAAGRGLAALLFQIRPADPLSLAAAALTLLAIGLAAAYAPARRASRLDPARTLRSE